MIGTIGSLVQEASSRSRWLTSASLYSLACVSTSVLLGALLATAGGWLARLVPEGRMLPWPSSRAEGLIGIIAVAYAFSDAGLIRLPHPNVMSAVPVTWWRWWGPRRAALAYGAALGLGVTTRIPFGAFYVLCAWCVLGTDPLYGALLMGTYGASRALVIFPASWGIRRYRTSASEFLSSCSRFLDPQLAQKVLTAALIAFGAAEIVAALLSMLRSMMPVG